MGAPEERSIMLPAFHPKPALRIEDTGLPRGLVFELILKRTFLEGTTSLRHLIDETKLDFGVVNAVFRNMQRDHLCEVKSVSDEDYGFTLTVKGTRMAEEAYRKNQYCGPAPVPLSEYSRVIRAQAHRPPVNKEAIARSLSDMVITDDTIEDLGAAVMSGGTLFLYGPTGNGKTSIAERLARLFEDLVYIPHAVEVSGHILNVYDAVVHQAADVPVGDIDRRWMLCRRPFLKVGGELRADMLEPRIDELTRICQAPVQMLANNGILVIDDFGRQRMSPHELLNRWIVPLDRKVDYLSLWSGIRFEVPFDVLVVFATNLDLSTLAEEAFLRRIRHKVKVDSITPDIFVGILRQVCRQSGLESTPEVEQYLCQQCVERSPQGLRACYPTDLLETLCGVAAFEERPPQFDRAHLDRALGLYFGR